MGILEQKNEKENRLLDTAFKLFTEKGIKGTSIQEIVDNANVAKGTFYLYFKDKYEIRDVLIAKKFIYGKIKIKKCDITDVYNRMCIFNFR